MASPRYAISHLSQKPALTATRISRYQGRYRSPSPALSGQEIGEYLQLGISPDEGRWHISTLFIGQLQLIPDGKQRPAGCVVLRSQRRERLPRPALLSRQIEPDRAGLAALENLHIDRGRHGTLDSVGDRGVVVRPFDDLAELLRWYSLGRNLHTDSGAQRAGRQRVIHS